MQRVTVVTRCICWKITEATAKATAKLKWTLGSSGLVESGLAGYNTGTAGRGSVRLEHTVRDREVGGSNPLAPTFNPLTANDLRR
jgi:hypothetical protein